MHAGGMLASPAGPGEPTKCRLPPFQQGPRPHAHSHVGGAHPERVRAEEEEEDAADRGDGALIHPLRKVLPSQHGRTRAHGVAQRAPQRHAHHVRPRRQACAATCGGGVSREGVKERRRAQLPCDRRVGARVCGPGPPPSAPRWARRPCLADSLLP